MKRLWFLILLLMLGSCYYNEIKPDNTPNLRPLSSAEVSVSSSTNDFAFTLLNKVNNNENTFISPLSVSIALGMVLNGASEDTKKSILDVIDFSDLTGDEVNQAYKDLTSLLLSMDRTVNLGIANSVWYDKRYTVNNKFSGIITNYYDGVVQSLDFNNQNSVKTINNWVENKTNSRIKNLIDQISADEIMFLINAIYFKGDWAYQFDASKTHQANFTREDGSSTQVDMMFSKGAKIKYGSSDNVQLVDIPYGNGQFRLTLLVPLNTTLQKFVETLTSTQLDHWLDNADSVTVELEIPKFKMTWKKDLKETLETLGMNMSGFPDLFNDPLELGISRVIHQSFLEINEKGSEAAAATAIGIELTSAPSIPQRITIDRPFIFFIRENHSGVILFNGMLKDPAGLEH